MKTINDAHREALSAGCPAAQIARRIDKRTTLPNGDAIPVTKGVTLPTGAKVQRSAVVSVPEGPWRAALLAAGWERDGDGCSVEVDHGVPYNPKALGLESRPSLESKLGAGWTVCARGDFALAAHDSGLIVDVPPEADVAPVLAGLAAGTVGRHRLVDGQLLRGGA